jgi:hypothetical protein
MIDPPTRHAIYDCYILSVLIASKQTQLRLATWYNVRTIMRTIMRTVCRKAEQGCLR